MRAETWVKEQRFAAVAAGPCPSPAPTNGCGCGGPLGRCGPTGGIQHLLNVLGRNARACTPKTIFLTRGSGLCPLSVATSRLKASNTSGLDDQSFETPCVWHAALVSVISKKGEATTCDNYRPICLSAVGYKLSASISLTPLTDVVVEEIRNMMREAFWIPQVTFIPNSIDTVAQHASACLADF